MRSALRDWRQPWVVGVSSGATGTGLFVNGEDWTHDRTPITGKPGRITLAPGAYTLESFGYNPDRYVNSGAFDEVDSAAIRFTGVARANASNNILPGSVTSTSNPIYSGSGNLKFRLAGDTAPAGDAVRFDGVDDGLLGPDDFLVGRPSTIFIAYQKLETETGNGRMLQSGSGGNYLLGLHDENSSLNGMYAEGYVAQHYINDRVPSVSIAVQASDHTRYFYNGQDLTLNPLITGNLGRVAVGGGEGTYFQPVNGDLAELLVYDRILTDSQRLRWRVLRRWRLRHVFHRDRLHGRQRDLEVRCRREHPVVHPVRRPGHH